MKYLIHLFRLMTQPSGRGRLIGAGNPKWQVLYKDGGKSVPMYYDVACDYASLYGGTVVKYKWK